MTRQSESTRHSGAGAALRAFRAIVAAQGGDATYVDDPRKFPRAPVVRPVFAPKSGWIAGIDAAALGGTVVRLGGGRARKTDSIDFCVGLVLYAHVGTRVQAGDCLLEIHARTDATADEEAATILEPYLFSEEKVDEPPLIQGRFASHSVD